MTKLRCSYWKTCTHYNGECLHRTKHIRKRSCREKCQYQDGAICLEVLENQTK